MLPDEAVTLILPFVSCARLPVQRTIVCQKSQTRLTQRLRNFTLDPPCNTDALEGARAGFDAVECAGATFFEEVFGVGRFRGDQLAQG